MCILITEHSLTKAWKHEKAWCVQGVRSCSDIAAGFCVAVLEMSLEKEIQTRVRWILWAIFRHFSVDKVLTSGISGEYV